MINFKKLITLTGLFALCASPLATTSVSALSGTLSAPKASSNSTYTYCTLPNNAGESFAISDVNGARQIQNNKAYFFVIRNDVNNVNGGRCIGFKQWTFVPYVAGHTTEFDLDTDGVPMNVRLSNSLPTLRSVSCDSDDTSIRIQDAQEDKLAIASVAGNFDFNYSTTEESNNVLRVRFARSNYSFTGTNKVSIYVSENVTSDRSYGFVPFVSGAYQASASRGDAELTTKSQVVRIDVDVNAVCNSKNYTDSSSIAKFYWRDSNNGDVVKWTFDGDKAMNFGKIFSIPNNTFVTGAGDMNNDGIGDLILRNSNGDVSIWYLNSNGYKASESYVTNINTQWQIQGIADFNRDGKNDFLWRNTNTGENVIWYMDNSRFLGQTQIKSADAGYSIVGAADFDRDGNADILWRNKSTGSNVVWYMNNNNVRFGREISNVESKWDISGVTDYNNDGNPDILFRDNQGQTVVWYTNNGNKIGHTNMQNVSTNWQVVTTK
jgi:FG-GAP-like repeat